MSVLVISMVYRNSIYHADTLGFIHIRSSVSQLYANKTWGIMRTHYHFAFSYACVGLPWRTNSRQQTG